MSCGCNATDLIKLGYTKYVSQFYSNAFSLSMHLYIASLLGLNHPQLFNVGGNRRSNTIK